MTLSKELTTVTRLSKIVALMLFFALPIIGFYIGMHYRQPIIVLNPPSTNIQRVTPILTPSAPTENTGKISDGTPQIMRDLRFRVPSGWWYKQTANSYYGDNWTEIHPQKPTNNVSVFVLKAVTGRFEPTFNQEYLTVIKEEQILVSNQRGRLIIGKITPPTDPEVTCPECFIARYKAGEIVAVATIMKGYNYYSFEGNISSYEKEFREILASFSFGEEE